MHSGADSIGHNSGESNTGADIITNTGTDTSTNVGTDAETNTGAHTGANIRNSANNRRIDTVTSAHTGANIRSGANIRHIDTVTTTATDTAADNTHKRESGSRVHLRASHNNIVNANADNANDNEC